MANNQTLVILVVVVVALVIWLCLSRDTEGVGLSSFATKKGPVRGCPPRRAETHLKGGCGLTTYVCENNEKICFPCRSKAWIDCRPGAKRKGEAACQYLFGVGMKKRHSECDTRCKGWNWTGCDRAVMPPPPWEK